MDTLFIDREAEEIIRFVASVRPSVRLFVCLLVGALLFEPLHYACGAEWSIYGLGLPSAKENHHDTWNTAQDLWFFFSNNEMFAIKGCAQRSGAFNF